MKQALEPMGRSIVLPGCQLTAVGLQWKGEPTEEELREIDLALQRCERSAAWWHGDFLCKRIDRDLAADAKERLIEYETEEDRRGRMRDAVRRFARGRNLDEYTCRAYLAVANMFPLVHRCTSLSHTHHLECWKLGLTIERAKEWLAKAEAGGWPVSRLRAEINASKTLATESEPDVDDDVPREISQFECWAATRWVEMQSVQPMDALRLLSEMQTAVRLVDHLRAVVAHGQKLPTTPGKESLRVAS